MHEKQSLMGKRFTIIVGGDMNNLDDLKEQIQEDIICYLDEYEIPQPCIDDLCYIIVDRVNELKENAT